MSDDEPLSSIQMRSRAVEDQTNIPAASTETIEVFVNKVSRGRPKGSTSDKRELYTDKNVLERVHLNQRSVRSDGVDEECAEAGIIYRR